MVFFYVLIFSFFVSIQARDVYEEGIQTVTTVRDFSTVFDAYAQFEETMISSLMERLDMGVCKNDVMLSLRNQFCALLFREIFIV